mgnify:CR=1 FL=1
MTLCSPEADSFPTKILLTGFATLGFLYTIRFFKKSEKKNQYKKVLVFNNKFYIQLMLALISLKTFAGFSAAVHAIDRASVRQRNFFTDQRIERKASITDHQLIKRVRVIIYASVQ